MPDADDFDVEYFRKLLKGNAEKQESQAPEVKPAAPANRKKPPAAALPPAKGTGKPAISPKKPGKR